MLCLQMTLPVTCVLGIKVRIKRGIKTGVGLEAFKDSRHYRPRGLPRLPPLSKNKELVSYVVPPREKEVYKEL